MANRTFTCTCCGTDFKSDKPHDWNLDRGYGWCPACRPRKVEDMVKYQFIDPEKAERLADRYA